MCDHWCRTQGGMHDFAAPTYGRSTESIVWCCCCCCCPQVVASLQELYDRHKGSYGWQDRPLSIE